MLCQINKKNNIPTPKLNKVKMRGKILSCCFLFASLSLAGCANGPSSWFGQTLHEGYIFDQDDLSFITPKSSMDHVLLTLGSPSLTGEGQNKVFYYISQQRYRSFAFLKPHLVKRDIIAIYFDNKEKVTKIAHYGLKDGEIIDFISQTTPASGREKALLEQIMGGSQFNPLGTLMPKQP